MPSTKDLFPFYLSADDLKGRSHLVTIEQATVINVYNPHEKRKDPRLSLRFHKAKLSMLINKTQAITLENITGTDDYSRWVGHQVILSPAPSANGRDTIAVSRPPETAAPSPAEQPEQPAPAAEEEAAQPDTPE